MSKSISILDKDYNYCRKFYQLYNPSNEIFHQLEGKFTDAENFHQLGGIFEIPWRKGFVTFTH